MDADSLVFCFLMFMDVLDQFFISHVFSIKLFMIIIWMFKSIPMHDLHSSKFIWYKIPGFELGTNMKFIKSEKCMISVFIAAFLYFFLFCFVEVVFHKQSSLLCIFVYIVDNFVFLVLFSILLVWRIF